MFFSDGADAAAGASAFLNNFGSGDAVTPETESTIPEPDSQEGATDADTSFSTEADDGQDLSDEDLFAARLADSLAEEGIELEGADDDEEPEADEADDFENMTPEQIKELAKEALLLKEKDKETTQETAQATVRQAIAAAQDAAVAEVEAAFEQDVLYDSRRHYMGLDPRDGSVVPSAEMTKRINDVIKNSYSADNQHQYLLHNILATVDHVVEARRGYEAKKAQEWNAVVQQAREQAVWNVPELRDFYARDLVQRMGLPEEALKDINHPNRDIRAFEQRAQELVDVAKFAAAKQKQTTDQQKKAARERLKTQKVGTAPTGRQKGGKPRTYTGTAEEGLPILKALSSRW